MKTSDLFPSKYLRADDLDGREPVLTIAKIKKEKLGDQTKLIIYFKGKEKGLVINKTNCRSIEEISGSDDTDDWPGTKIKLITAKVEYQGRRVPAIRIEETEPSSPKPKRSRATVVINDPPDEPPTEDSTAPAEAEAADIAPDEDDIPF